MRINIISLIIISVLSTTAFAEIRTFNDWTVSWGGGIYEAYTAAVNESGSTLGVLCTVEQCTFYLRVGATCHEGSSYLTLMNSESGADSYKLSCVPLTLNRRTEYVFLIGDLENFAPALLNSSTVGFAIPMASGQFKVSRFSLRGFSRAVQLIGDLSTTGN